MATKSANKKPLRLWLLLGAILILLGAGLPLLLPGAEDTVFVTDAGDSAASLPDIEPAGEPQGRAVEAMAGSPTEVGFSDEPKKVAGATGTILGSVGLDSRLADKVTSCTLLLVEAMNPNRPDGQQREPRMRRQQLAFEPGRRTAEFRLEGIPFSDYGWNLRVFSPGVNGSEQVLMLSKKDSVKTAHLDLRPATSLRVTLKDQQYRPVPKVRVYLKPSGSHLLGRPGYPANPDTLTDNSGFLLIDGVLKGEYQLLIGDPRQPMIPPKTVVVGDKETQLLQVEVPRGGNAIFRVALPGGYGAPDVKIQAVAKDSKVYRQHLGKTDRAGHAVLEYLPAGEYLVYFTKKGYDQVFKQITVPASGKVEHTISLQLTR